MDIGLGLGANTHKLLAKPFGDTIASSHMNTHWTGQSELGQARDIFSEGGGKEQGLPGRHVLENLQNGAPKSHVEQRIHFVKDENFYAA